MRKKGIAFLSLALLLTFIPYSCSLDDDNGYADYPFARATINVIEGNDYYFSMDDGKTIYPGDTTNIRGYKVKDGQRAHVWMDLLDEKVSGYDYNARIMYIRDILTKGIIPITEATQDSIGNDPVNITNVWFGGGYLNIEFQLLGTNNPSDPHMINLVRDENAGEEKTDGYINLEFRHNLNGDYPHEIYYGLVCFKPPFTDDETAKGLRIKVNTIYEGVKYIDVKFSEASSNTKNLAGNYVEAI